MAKRQTRSRTPAPLFKEHEEATTRRRRRVRSLIIPRLLAQAADSRDLEGADRENARAILLRWSDLEEDGHLARHKETSLNADFLNEVFGDALRYGNKIAIPADYGLEREFTVPGIGTADGALGRFPHDASPIAVIELKDIGTDLDRTRSSGRSPVQQCWDYLSALPDCPWGIVSNFSTIRLYHRARTPLAYEDFTLREMRDERRFNEFYCLFERGGLLDPGLGRQPRALQLLKKTEERQRTVGDDLYKAYQHQRNALIAHLHLHEKRPLDAAIRIAQKLLDRIIFIAFCEDRELLPAKTLDRAYTHVGAYEKATNPRWRNFVNLFHGVDKGHPALRLQIGYNGGLFNHDPEVDELELPDEPWTLYFRGFGDWDFREEINVDVLGHIFERSITELEKLRLGGLFALQAAENGDKTNGSKTRRAKANGEAAPEVATGDSPGRDPISKMPKSAQRKRFGIYYTPPAFTGLLVENTVDELVRERFHAAAKKHVVDPEARIDQDPLRMLAYWRACGEVLKALKVCDPACGSGAFLIRAYEALEGHYRSVVDALAALSAPEAAEFEEKIPEYILEHNLYGVDVSLEAVEITQLALWIRSARPGRTLANLSQHIRCGNSLVTDKAVHDRAMDWKKAFPDAFAAGADGGFDCVIGNPPWERVKLQEREFFSLVDPETAQAVSAAERRKRIASLPRRNPELHQRYQDAREQADRLLTYARTSKRYPLAGKGDINTYMLFAELASKIVAPDGLVGLLVPSGIATDDTTKAFFNRLMDNQSLVCLYDFENKAPVFPDVHRSFKFTALVFGGAARKTPQADFVFFARTVEEVAPSNRGRHIALGATDMALLNPNTRTCPVFRTRRDAQLTKFIYRRVPVLIDENRKQGGNPWGIQFLRMFDQTNDAEHFRAPAALKAAGFRPDGNRWKKGKKVCLPLYEAKMVQAYDHRAASVVIEGNNWVRQGQTLDTTPVQHANPEHTVLPRWWVAEAEVSAVVKEPRGWFLGFKDITSPTNTRTMIAAAVPWCAATNKLPLLLTDASARLQCCLLANLNSFALDYVTRQKIGGITLNFFIVEQLPVFPPEKYAERCPWDRRKTLETWISERVLKLTCTADDMRPLAEAAAFPGSRTDGVHPWRESERAELLAELDAAYFRLYEIEREDVEYILTTFRGPDRREDGDFGPERTGDMILRAYDGMAFA